MIWERGPSVGVVEKKEREGGRKRREVPLYPETLVVGAGRGVTEAVFAERGKGEREGRREGGRKEGERQARERGRSDVNYTHNDLENLVETSFVLTQ